MLPDAKISLWPFLAKISKKRRKKVPKTKSGSTVIIAPLTTQLL
jgi:hypothetical protein